MKKTNDFSMCECGHFKRMHYLGRGVCEGHNMESANSANRKGMDLRLMGQCRCSRFKHDPKSDSATLCAARK